MRYDHQIILQTQRDATLRRMGEALFNKARDQSTYFVWELEGERNELVHERGAIPPAGSRIRVYIVGHGDISQLHVALHNGVGLARKFGQLGIHGHYQIQRISIVSCFSTSMTRGQGEPRGLVPEPRNFAQTFHAILRREFGLRTEVSARGALVNVRPDGRKETGFYEGNVTVMEHKMADTKWIYYWKDNGDPGRRRPRLEVWDPMDVE